MPKSLEAAANVYCAQREAITRLTRRISALDRCDFEEDARCSFDFTPTGTEAAMTWRDIADREQDLAKYEGIRARVAATAPDPDTLIAYHFSRIATHHALLCLALHEAFKEGSKDLVEAYSQGYERGWKKKVSWPAPDTPTDAPAQCFCEACRMTNP